MKQIRRPAFPVPVRPVAQRAFTLIELLTVIAVMGILAGLLVGLAPAAMKRARESRVRSELQALEAAIESYKAKYGVYPPDGLALGANGAPLRDSNGNLVVRPELNPLYYELTGVIVNKVPAVSAEADRRLDDLARIVGKRAIWQPSIPQRVIVNQAIGERRPIHAYGSRATDITEVFDRLWSKLRKAIKD